MVTLRPRRLLRLIPIIHPLLLLPPGGLFRLIGVLSSFTQFKLLQDKDAQLDDLREENALNEKRIDGLYKWNTRLTDDYNKLIQDKDAQLDDLRKENAINAKRIDRLYQIMDVLIPKEYTDIM